MAFSTQCTSCHLHILLVEYLRDIAGCQVVTGHLQRVEPDTHRIVGTHHVHLAHTRDTAETWLDVDLRIVGQERTVEGAVRTIDRELLDVRCLTFSHSESTLHYVAWQTPLYSGSTVLYVHHRHIGVSALTEEDTDRGSTVVGGCRRHVHHALDTIDGFLKRHDDTLLHRLGIGTSIAGHDAHDGWGNLRELFQGELTESDDTHQNHQYGDDS